MFGIGAKRAGEPRTGSAWGTLALAGLLATAAAAQRVPNVEGTYGGVLVSRQTGPVAALLPYIEQDNITQLSGNLTVQTATPLTIPVAGAIHPNDKCRLIGSADGVTLRFRATWRKLGLAGALFGPVTYGVAGRSFDGTMAFLRPFPLGAQPKPAWKGNYSGAVTDSVAGRATATASIADGTSNTFALRIVAGRSTVNLAADVDSDGTVAGVGVTADGNAMFVAGTFVNGRLSLTYSMEEPTGGTLNTGSIIAILIG